jgi:hypothetical protein
LWLRLLKLASLLLTELKLLHRLLASPGPSRQQNQPQSQPQSHQLNSPEVASRYKNKKPLSGLFYIINILASATVSIVTNSK